MHNSCSPPTRYLGNYYYTLNNKLALKAAGGATGFPVTIGFMQLLIGSVYALWLWIQPDARPLPETTTEDLMKIVPVAACAAGAHLSSIFSMNLGAVSFAQIVKASEPAFAAAIGTALYGKKISKAKWLCLIPVIGGVCLASIKELDFSVWALLAACIANVFAAFRSNENKKLMCATAPTTTAAAAAAAAAGTPAHRVHGEAATHARGPHVETGTRPASRTASARWATSSPSRRSSVPCASCPSSSPPRPPSSATLSRSQKRRLPTLVEGPVPWPCPVLSPAQAAVRITASAARKLACLSSSPPREG